MKGTRENLTGRRVRIEAGKDIKPHMALVFNVQTGETIDNVQRVEIDLDVGSLVNRARLHLYVVAPGDEQGHAEQVDVDVECTVLAQVEHVETKEQ